METITVTAARRREAIGQQVRLQGWIRTRRDSKGGFSFLEVNDGSCMANLQIVVDSDACLSDCRVASCGDGIVYSGVEACDDGNQLDGDGCDSACLPEPVCGDGVLDAGEGCDDGNSDDDDGCSSGCTVVAGWTLEYLVQSVKWMLTSESIGFADMDNEAVRNFFSQHYEGFIAGKWPLDPVKSTIVLIHGAGGSSFFWQAQVEALAERVNTVAIDLPGHGQSDGSGYDRVEDYARSVANFIDAIDAAVNQLDLLLIGICIRFFNNCRNLPV